VGCATSLVSHEAKGLKSITECRAADGANICLQKLKGKDHKSVVEFLGKPQRTHEKEEYLYYPERSDESMWLLLVSFDEHNRVCNVFSNELLPPKPKHEKAEPITPANDRGGRR
jgi:hypothetical protein